MPKRDSVDKVVESYMAAVASKPFTYEGKQFEPVRLTVSPLLLRGYTCPARCGGCCPTFSLDYLPGEPRPYAMPDRFVKVNGRMVQLYSDTQEERAGEHFCKHLQLDTGRCGIHGKHPFSCDFELIRFLHYAEKRESLMLTRLYGRGHQFLRVDGERGAQCSITPVTDESVADVVRKLQRLAQWCEHFHVPHRVGTIIEWARSKPTHPLVLPGTTSPGLFY